jgi:pimeloyl-ACP methyl ester carboxylesterase
MKAVLKANIEILPITIVFQLMLIMILNLAQRDVIILLIAREVDIIMPLIVGLKRFVSTKEVHWPFVCNDYGMDLLHGKIKIQDFPEVCLHYVEVKHQLDAPVILLLHGFPEFWYTWKDYLEPLAAAGFHPVALDLRGYNTSSKPQGKEHYELSILVEDIKKVLIHFNKKAFIVGHDWGGIITWEFAANHPELCQGIVVLNAPHPAAMVKNENENFRLAFRQNLKFWYAGFFQLPLVPEKMLKAFNYKLIERIFKTQSDEKSYPQSDIDKLKEAITGPDTLTSMLNYYRANLHILGKRKMNRISAPTLLFWGEKDAALDRGITENMNEFFTKPITKHYFPEASHWVHRECREKILELIIPFFKELL